jgi:carnitine-CoA ligase
VVVFEDELRDAVLAVKDSLPSLRASVVADGVTGNGVDRTVDRLLDHPDAEPEVEVEETSVGGVGMMYTSGTTGPPKGVVATKYDRNPMQLILDASGVKPGETMYTSLPLFHANALLVSMIGSMVLDAKFALGERFSASRFFDECRKHDAVEFNIGADAQAVPGEVVADVGYDGEPAGPQGVSQRRREAGAAEASGQQDYLRFRSGHYPFSFAGHAV